MSPTLGTPSPGQNLQSYLSACEQALDWYAKSKVSWSEMMDLREQAAARLNGHLVDHFLVRAHNRRSLVLPPSAPADSNGR